MECSGVLARLGVRAAMGWLLLALSLCALPALAGTDTALAWLNTQKQPDGGYALPNSLATPAQATAEALRTLRALSPGAARDSSLQFLDAAAAAGPAEYLARALVARAEAGDAPAALKAALEAGQNPDGGFGGAPGFSSTVLDTAYALQALAKAGGSGRAAAALGYLQTRQQADGGFPLDGGGGQGSAYATAAALATLNAHRLGYDLARPVARAAGFLLAAQADGGGWGGDFETAWALLALVPATTDGAVLAPAARALEAAQRADGSWGGDACLTALAARALGAMRGSAGDPPPWDGVVMGRVLGQAGGLPLAGATVALAGDSRATAVTDAAGAYRLVAPPGAFTLTASAAGFLDASASVTLAAGTAWLFSPSLAAAGSSPPAAARLQGTVVDAGTGLALAGVQITAVGGGQGGVTGADGGFSLAGLAPGGWQFDLALAGYQPLRVSLAAPAGLSDVGALRLAPLAAPATTTLSGTVADNATGAPLAGATVAVPGEGKSARTAADGSYRIEGIAAARFTVAVSAVGYVSHQGEAAPGQPGPFTLDAGLDRAAADPFDIDQLSPGQPGYPAYSKIQVEAHVVNGSAVERKVRLYAVVTDAAGRVAAQFPAKAASGGDPASALETVPAGGAATAAVEWRNGALAPGWYDFIVQAYDGASGQLLAERGVPVELLATRAIGGSAEFDPPIAQLAAKQPVRITAKVGNRGNLGLAGGTATATVTLKNPGYPAGNPAPEIQTLAQGGGLNRPYAVDRDGAGNLYAVNYADGTLSRIDAAGAATPIAAGFDRPVDVDVAPNGDIYVVNFDSFERLAADGSRQRVATGIAGQKAIEVLAAGRIFIAAGGAGVYNVTLAGGKANLDTGNAWEIQADAQGTVYVGNNSKGTISRIGDGDVLETVQDGLPSLETFAIAADGSIAAVYGGNSVKKLALFAPDGTRREITETLPATVMGSVWGADGRIVLSVDGPNTLVKLYLPTPPGAVGAGEAVYAKTLALPALALDAAAAPLDFGSWVPALSGDFQVEVSVDSHPEHGALRNTLHVGPNAHGSIDVAAPTVRPGDRATAATLRLFGADSTSVTRIDPGGTVLAAVSKTNGRGVAADTKGNLYATNASTASSIVRITPGGAVSTFASGYSLGAGLAVDAQDNLYAYPSGAATVLKITPDGKVAPLATVGGAIKGLAVGPDGHLYTVDAGNALSRIQPDGRVDLVAKNGISNAKGLAIDANGYFYIPTDNAATHLDEDGVSRTYHKVVRVSPDGLRYSDYHTQARYEFEGVNITADCSNNLLFAPLSNSASAPWADYPFKSYNYSGEEDTLLQLVGDTGEERQVLHGPDIDPGLADMDVLFYDRFGQRLLVWTDLSNGKIFSFPVVCGGIDADVHLVTRADVGVSGLSPPPDRSADLGGGVFEHVWSLAQADSRGVELKFNLLLKGLAKNESRPVAQDAYVEYHNSFAPGQPVRTPLAIPGVLADAAVAIQPRLDASQYGPMAPVGIRVGVARPFGGELRLAVVDAAGNRVQELPPVAVADQAEAASVDYAALWNTGLFLAGDYTLLASLHDKTGAVLAAGSAPFAIAPGADAGAPLLSDRLAPDKLVYGGWDRVRLEGQIANAAANALLEPALMAVSVRAPDGTLVYAGSAQAGQLAPGGASAVGFEFALADAAAGVYTVDAKVLSAADGAVLDAFQKTFAVVRTALQGLAGGVAAAPGAVPAGAPVVCRESVLNRSAADTGPLALSGVLADLDHGTVLGESPYALALAGGQSAARDRAVDTQALPPGHYACVLRAAAGGLVRDLASAAFQVDAPQAALSGTVFHDFNHNRARDAGEPGTDAGGAWVSALRQGVAVAAAPVGADGGWRLAVPGLAAYTLALSAQAGGGGGGGTALPIGWSHTGESRDGLPDAAADGRLDAAVGAGGLSALDFAVDGAPSSAANDAADTAQGVAVALPVLANDWPGPGAARLLAGSLDLDPATPAVDKAVAIPGEGAFTAGADGVLRFAPLPGFSGVSSVAYAVRDDLGQPANPALATVTVAGPANPAGGLDAARPHANPDQAATPAATPVALDAVSNDAAGAGASLDLATLDLDLDPATAAIDSRQTTPEGDWQAQADGSVRFTPAPGYGGLALQTYAVTDSGGRTAASTLAVRVGGGGRPLALDDSGATWPGVPLALSPFNNDLAAAGRAWAADSLDLDPSTPGIDAAADRAEGRWQARPDGTLDFTPADGFTGNASLSYALADGSGEPAGASVQVAVLPTQAPAALDDDISTPFNTPARFAPAANDRAARGAVLDPATLDLDPATDAVETSLDTAEGGWRVQPDGSLEFTPARDQAGAVAPLSYLVRDSLGRAAAARVRLAVAPPPSVGLSGRVFLDLDRSQAQNGNEPGTDAGGLFATAVAADGGYRLDVPPLAAYTLVLSTQAGGVAAALPPGWHSAGGGPVQAAAGVVALAGLDFAVYADPPAAEDDRAATPHGAPAALSPLANDRPGPAAGLDPAALDLDPSTPAADGQIDAAGQGRYAAQSGGGVVFTPLPSFSGVSQAAYLVRDALGQPSNAAALRVAVGPAAAADSLTTPAGTPAEGSLAAHSAAPAGAAYALDTPPAHGTATVRADGGYTYRPADGYSGPDRFTYRVCLPAPDDALCDSAPVSATVAPGIDLRATLEPDARGRLLVLLDPPPEECREDGGGHGEQGGGGREGGGHEEQGGGGREGGGHEEQGGDGREGEDGHGEDCQAWQAKRGYLARVLDAGGWSHAVADDAETYARALRGGGYALHALLSARVKLDEAVQKELREAVNHGLGLLVGGDHDQRDNGLDDALGLQYTGRARAFGLQVPPAAGYDGLDLGFAAPAEAATFRPQTAAVLGRFLDARRRPAGPALARQNYGLGKAAYLGFDLPAEGAAREPAGLGPFSQLLLNLLDDLAPAPAGRPGDVAGLRLRLSNRGAAADGWAGLSLQGGAAFLDPAPAALQGDGSLRWPFRLGQNESLERRAWARRPAAGAGAARAEIHAGGGPADPRATAGLALPVAETPALPEALARLDALAADGPAYRPARQSARRAADALARGRHGDAREALLQAADALLKLPGPAAAEARQAVGEALRRLGLAEGAAAGGRPESEVEPNPHGPR